MANMVGKEKAVANGGGGAGVAAKVANPGSAVQAVGGKGKLGGNETPDVGGKAAGASTFSQHPGHGSAKKTIAAYNPNIMAGS